MDKKDKKKIHVISYQEGKLRKGKKYREISLG